MIFGAVFILLFLEKPCKKKKRTKAQQNFKLVEKQNNAQKNNRK